MEPSTLPGAPNYESINNGDFPSERWFIIPNEESKKYLRDSGVFETIPESYRPVLENWKRSNQFHPVISQRRNRKRIIAKHNRLHVKACSDEQRFASLLVRNRWPKETAMPIFA